MAYETSIICDKCSERISHTDVYTKQWMIRCAREKGWTIGKRELCPNCRKKRRKAIYRYLLITRYAFGSGDNTVSGKIKAARDVNISREIIRAENESKARVLADEIICNRFGERGHREFELYYRVEKLTKESGVLF